MRRRRAWPRQGTGEEGSALVELALVVGLLGVPLLLGTAEFAPILYDYAEVGNAAHAAALYGTQSTIFAADTLGMINAAQTEAADFGTSLVVTPLTYYVCSGAVGGAQYTGANALRNAQAACTGTANHPLQMVQVLAVLQMTPPVQCPGLPTSFQLSGTSVMEVQQ